MKSYTDLSQSKKLVEFLSIESADMHWQYIEEDNGQLQWFCFPKDFSINQHDTILAWSLAALLGVLPIIGKDKKTANPFIAKTPTGEYYVVYATLYKEIDSSGIYSNPVDACYEMIIYLHEQNLL